MIDMYYSLTSVDLVVVDKGLSSEGVPGMADGSINKEVDSEVNKFA